MRFRAILIFTVLAVLVTVIGILVCAGVSAVRAEDRYLATCIVLEGLTQHLNATGEWPRSWDELYRSSLYKKPGWPVDELQRLVRIDFEVTAAEVAAMTTETFDAVEPLGASYPLNEGFVKTLLDTATEQSSAGDQAPKSQAAPQAKTDDRALSPSRDSDTE